VNDILGKEKSFPFESLASHDSNWLSPEFGLHPVRGRGLAEVDRDVDDRSVVVPLKSAQPGLGLFGRYRQGYLRRDGTRGFWCAIRG